ncbi:hypothetical protein GUJ93_ZPchr0005g16007 [Zizania palustris]|uniref:Uncharacterized protein n=1 Tax=Zizania palustris TaxID=103762 RepID=A0A8J5SXH5_ZIZPA|nr:hypothetical protein GUJ93_ZPchr0005g16007 [Zizania palustris]
MRILEQGASNLQGGGEGSAEAVGMLMLTMSTLLYRRGRRQDAMEKLKATQQVAPSAAFRGAFIGPFASSLDKAPPALVSSIPMSFL